MHMHKGGMRPGATLPPAACRRRCLPAANLRDCRCPRFVQAVVTNTSARHSALCTVKPHTPQRGSAAAAHAPARPAIMAPPKPLFEEEEEEEPQLRVNQEFAKRFEVRRGLDVGQ